MENNIAAIYVAKPEFLHTLCEEVGEVTAVIENLVFSPRKYFKACFAQDIWLEPQFVKFQSISEAVKILRQAGKFWYLHPIAHIRRSRLIEEQLRKCPLLLRHFPVTEIPSIGCFSLLDQHTLVYSVQRLKKWPQGQCFFIEDKINPPNRAYLKLWEALTLLEKHPIPGEWALDLGASPGGWTYVMHSLGANVTAIDKAPLDIKIATLSNVNFIQQSAFALEPAQLDRRYDWVLSDVACYPERAYTLINKWIESGKAKQLIFTIKLQGKNDLASIKPFQAIPNSYITNLFYNKHEATFFYPAPSFF
ncbi:SAM-dependent methyltransferase [Legionella jamestowniensis]|uniref:SAM-dependent methyltransferase n=1 Tax=Legionella jamestowniensis TaxID=455 RepID=A0ABX2XZM0_9GAMM|nr:SAM-dependent methyltransferase [Legionella jamestowniensis]OCH97370.1 SAM-dependent methyltransferase [Legionella jamestowniensis]